MNVVCGSAAHLGRPGDGDIDARLEGHGRLRTAKRGGSDQNDAWRASSLTLLLAIPLLSVAGWCYFGERGLTLNDLPPDRGAAERVPSAVTQLDLKLGRQELVDVARLAIAVQDLEGGGFARIPRAANIAFGVSAHGDDECAGAEFPVKLRWRRFVLLVAERNTLGSALRAGRGDLQAFDPDLPSPTFRE